MPFPVPSFADIVAALWKLGELIAGAVKGTPAPPIADTHGPDGMTAQERAAKQQALADAEAARAKVNATGAPRGTVQ